VRKSIDGATRSVRGSSQVATTLSESKSQRADAITDMKEQGRDAKEVSGHKTDAMVNRVYDRRRLRRGPAVK
jgi:hypothetical protein